MPDISIQIPEIKRKIAEGHAQYMERFGRAVAIVEGEDQLRRTRIKAKLDLLCKAFKASKVVDVIEYGVVSSRDGSFPMSVAFGRKDGPIRLYLLNTGRDIIVSDSVGLAQTSDTVESRIVLVTDTKRVCRRFKDVLDEKFDWLAMAMFVLESVHETLYDRHDAVLRELRESIG